MHLTYFQYLSNLMTLNLQKKNIIIYLENQTWFLDSFESSYIFEPLNILNGPSFRLTQFFLQVLSNIWILSWKNRWIFVKCQQFLIEILDISLTKVKVLTMLQISWRSLSAKIVKSQISTDCFGKVNIYKSN